MEQKNMLNNTIRLLRLAQFGQEVWNLLTEEEQKNYVEKSGKLGFLFTCLQMLGIVDTIEFYDDEHLNFIMSYITKEVR